NSSRGKRRKQALGASVTSAAGSSPEPDSPAEHYARQRRRNWARLLKKIYEADPFTCPCCGSQMRIISFIEEAAVIRKVLQHLDLWERPPQPARLWRGSPPPSLFPRKLEAFLATLYHRALKPLMDNSFLFESV
ncbi:MAG TPA: hypothetical protein VMY18_05040, partial [Acidobacteriota bacterium]|nr:hypothetical protein [Acidobacteriota bacterium]